MCGIFGICFTAESKALEELTLNEMAKVLFPAIRHRGPHAFGWMTWNGAAAIDHDKFEGDVGLVRNLAHVDVDESAMWMVGHVRWATHGSTGDSRNNHPIPHGDIIGVHNGVLRNDEAVLAITGRQDPGTEVDSEAIFAAVNKWGHRAGLRKIDGDMVAVYARYSKPGWLYIAKSYGRPLVIARTKAGSLVFASELKVLREVWGSELTDIRELRKNQLIRVADAKVVESVQYQEDAPPKPAPRVPAIRTGTAPRGLDMRGITEYYEQKRRALAESLGAAAKAGPAAKPTAQRSLSKKQKRRARRARLAQATSQWGEGFYWVNGECLTPAQYAQHLNDEHDEQAAAKYDSGDKDIMDMTEAEYQQWLFDAEQEGFQA